jgi:hypothetical protein
LLASVSNYMDVILTSNAGSGNAELHFDSSRPAFEPCFSTTTLEGERATVPCGASSCGTRTTNANLQLANFIVRVWAKSLNNDGDLLGIG